MQPIVGKGFEMVGRLTQPRQRGVWLDFKHPRHRTNSQPFGQSRDCAHDPLSRVGLAIQGRAVRFEKIGVTGHAVELAPGLTPRMAVSADITPCHPAIIRAGFGGTVLVMRVYSSGASALGSDQGWRGKPEP